jgi:hypothetical protein
VTVFARDVEQNHGIVLDLTIAGRLEQGVECDSGGGLDVDALRL